MTRVRADIAVGVAIARAELWDLLRRNDSRRQRATLALLALLVLPVWLSAIRQGHALGVMTRDGTGIAVVPVARNVLVPGLLVVALFGGLGAAQSIARNGVRPLVLTSAPARAIVLGKVLYLLSTWLLLLGLAAVPAVAYAVGARAPLFLVALVAGGVPLLLLTMGVGLSLAYLLWLAIERLGLPEVARRLVTASLSVVAFLVAFVLGLSLGRTAGNGAALPTGEPVVPLGWYADLLFVGSPMAEPLGLRTALAALFVWAALPLTFLLLVRLAPAYWYATPTKSGGSDDADASTTGPPAFEHTPSERIGRAGGALGNSRTLRAAFGYARSAVRRPDQYVYLFYYLFPVAMGAIPVAVNEPALVPAAVGVGLILLGIWFAGSVVCLNPLGAEGAMLSQLVLAPAPAETFVHARLLVGVAIGAAFSVTGSLLVVAWWVGVPPASVASLWTGLLVAGTLTAVLLTSAAFALAIGSVLPKFETTEVFDSVETLVPSVFAAVIHGFVSLVVLVGGVLVVVALAPGNPLSVSRPLAVLGTAVFALALVALADGSRRYAIARLRDYGEHPTLDRPFAVYAAAGLAVLSLLLGQVAALSAVLVFGIDLPVEVLLPVLFVVEYLGVLVVALGFLYVTRRGLAYLDIRWPSLREVGAVAGGVFALLALWAATGALVEGLGLPAAEHALFEPGEGDPTLLLALVPLVLLVNAPLEELLYRNVIQKYLAERFSTASAVALASVVFALAHVPAFAASPLAIGVTLALLFVLSCVLGALYAWTRSLVVVAAVHGLYNAILLLGLYLTAV